MEWRDEGLVIGVKRHGESAVILELMTRAHGRHMGLVRGGAGRALRSVLQPGNSVEALWRARIEQHLGCFAVEPVRSRVARLIDRAFALHGVGHLCALLRLLPERDPHGELFAMAEVIADRLDSLDVAPALMARFELALLAALGFGLDLERCALTGETLDLAYVSPKTGRAVARAAAAPWQDRLLPYPAFLRAPAPARADAGALVEAFRLTGHFLQRDVFGPRGLAAPPARALYIAAAAAN
jgi:DNA repair protein RecO (recombination protein O)